MKIIIDGKVCEAEYGEYILDIARRNDIYIPTVCQHDSLSGIGSCRLCIVEVIGGNRSKVVTSCLFPVTKEIYVDTCSEKIIKMRKTILKLLLARASENEYVKKLAKEYGIEDIVEFNIDKNDECILCGLCVKACEEVGTNSISTVNRGIFKKVSTPYDEPSKTCIGCSACAFVCPTNNIKVHDEEGKRTIWGKSFELVKCQNCGEYFATKEQIEFASQKLHDKENEFLCNRCKKRNTTEKFKEIYKDIVT